MNLWAVRLKILSLVVQWLRLRFQASNSGGCGPIPNWGTRIPFVYIYIWASQVALVVKHLPANARDIGDMDLIPGPGSSPGGGHTNPLQYSCLENPMDRGAWGIHSIVLQELNMTEAP